MKGAPIFNAAYLIRVVQGSTVTLHSTQGTEKNSVVLYCTYYIADVKITAQLLIRTVFW